MSQLEIISSSTPRLNQFNMQSVLRPTQSHSPPSAQLGLKGGIVLNNNILKGDMKKFNEFTVDSSVDTLAEPSHQPSVNVS